jgi:hypothetical protein
VPEHFREPEFMSLDSHDFLFCLIRLIGVHLFRFRLFTGIVRREASPPSEPLGGRSFSAEAGLRSVLVSSFVPWDVWTRLRADARESRDGTIGWDDHSR